MSGGSTSGDDDDDDLVTLMPNVMKLIRSGESSSLESKGSTSMSISGNGVKLTVERQDTIPTRRLQEESIYRQVANRFLRRRTAGKRDAKSSALATLSSNRRSSYPAQSGCQVSVRVVGALEPIDKENVRPKSPTLVKQGARPMPVQEMAMRDHVSQKVTRKFRDLPSRSEVSSYFSLTSKIQRADKSRSVSGSDFPAQHASTIISRNASRKGQGSRQLSKIGSERGKARLYRTTMPLNLSELIEEFAEIDGEALEEEEESIAQMTRTAPVVATQTQLDQANGIRENSVEKGKYLSRNEREKVVSSTVDAKIEEVASPNYSHGRKQEGVGIHNSQYMPSRTCGLVQDVLEPEPISKANDEGLSSVRDPNGITSPMQHRNAPDNHDLNGDTEKRGVDENPPLNEQDSASPFLKGMDDQVRTAVTESTPCQLQDCAQETSAKGAGNCAKSEMANTDVGSHKIGYSPTKLNEENPKVTEADDPDENSLLREGSLLHHSSTFTDVQSSPSKTRQRPEQEDIGISLGGGNFSARNTSKTPPRQHYSRRRWIAGMNQRRLTFESDSDSKQKAVAVERDSEDVSVSTVQFKGWTISFVGQNLDANKDSVPQLPLADEEIIDQLNDRDCKDLSNPRAETQIEVDTEMLQTDTLADGGNVSAFQGMGETDRDPYSFSSLSPQAGRSTDCFKIRVGKRTWTNLGAPIDGGREWKEGRRVSTRIKSRPLDWWRGERMLYGRVHSTLCTLIGIKTTSPDPVWPRPKPQRGDYISSNFHVDSFVDDSHCELLRLAAQ